MSNVTFKISIPSNTTVTEDSEEDFDMSRVTMADAAQGVIEVDNVEASEDSDEFDSEYSDDEESPLAYSDYTMRAYDYFPAQILGVTKTKANETREVVIVKFICPQGLPRWNYFNSKMDRLFIFKGTDTNDIPLLDIEVDQGGDEDVWFSDRFISQQTDQDFVEEHDGHQVMSLKFTIDIGDETQAPKEEDAKKVLAYVMES